MSKVKVSFSATAITMERILQKPSNQTVVAKLAQEKIMPMVVERAAGHYATAIDIIRARIMDPNFTGSPLSSGSRRVGGRAFSGKQVRAVTESWNALSVDYVKRKPFSRRMWNKRGNLAASVDAILHAGKPRLRMKATPMGVKGARIRLAATLDFGTLPAPFDELIGLPFVKGNDLGSTVPRFSEGAPPHWKVVWPEGTRPFIRRLAARLGQEMLHDLRTIR